MTRAPAFDHQLSRFASSQVRGQVLISGAVDSVTTPTATAAVVSKGEMLWSPTGLSFWGGVDPLTSAVIDHTHPLFGQSVAGKVLAIPNGRGSCTGSQVVLELLLNGIAPSAMLLRQPDAIVALGVIVAEEMFGVSIPVLNLGEAGFAAVAHARHAVVSNGRVFFGDTAAEVEAEAEAADNAAAAAADPATEDMTAALVLTDDEQAMLGGRDGKAAALAMRILTRAAAIDSAPSLLPISQAHIDGCTYIGPGGLRFAQTLADLGGGWLPRFLLHVATFFSRPPPSCFHPHIYVLWRSTVCLWRSAVCLWRSAVCLWRSSVCFWRSMILWRSTVCLWRQ
jgi:predicted aconitase with swiveling domain